MSQQAANILPESGGRSLRFAVYWLLSAVAIGQVTGRLMAVTSVDRQHSESTRVAEELAKTKKSLVAADVKDPELSEKLAQRRQELEKKLQSQRPFLSSNDRSRWLTIRALVEYGTYAIDPIVTDPDQARVWDTIDMVKHRDPWDPEGKPRLYSSKPPLLATMLAGPYWVLYRTTGFSLRDDKHLVVRILLLLINVLPLGIFFWLVALITERYGTTDFGRVLVMATAAFGTFLTTFAVVLNNHITAAFCVMAALYAGLRIWCDGRRELRYFAVAGFFAALAAATELPALSFCVLLGIGLCSRAWKPTLVAFLPAAAVVAVAAVGTNYLSHGTVRPAYAFRTPGKDWETGNWYNYTYKVGNREIKSYWSRDPDSLARRSAIDRGEPSRARYALHSLVGHHGIFSLTPIWLLAFAGMAMMLFGRQTALRPWGTFVAVISLVCIAFYLGWEGEENRNYGGATCGLRWTFWLIPLWLFAMLPAADWAAGRTWRRLLCCVFLALSAFSASYPVWNPWTHPWLAQWMMNLGWVKL